MKIEVRFPAGVTTKQIVEVCSALGPLEADGYEFEVVVGTPAPKFDPHKPTPRDAGFPTLIANEVDPDPAGLDLEDLIKKPLPGHDEQEDANARRRVQRED